jgi:non-ribosomal peptide synthetase component F
VDFPFVTALPSVCIFYFSLNVDFQVLTVDASSSDGLALLVNFASDIISEAEVQAMLDHFEAALLFSIHHPYQSMTLVNLMNSRETQRILPTIKPDDASCSEHSMLALIEAQANRTPLKIAVCIFHRSHFRALMSSAQLQLTQEAYLTYKQMDSLANGLAHILIATGVNRGDLIGLYLDKSLETFISILATHKARAAYVPLDPDNPPHRIQTILGLAGSKIVLTSKDLQHQFNNAVLGADITSLVVDVHELSPSSKPDAGPIGRDDVCHVLFTSGSTGTPKGLKPSI